MPDVLFCSVPFCVLCSINDNFFFASGIPQIAEGGEIGVGSFGLVLFRALGGHFDSVAPSVLHMPGAFSRQDMS